METIEVGGYTLQAAPRRAQPMEMLVTIYARGMLYLSHSAYRALGMPRHVSLYLDEQAGVLGIAPARAGKPGARACTRAGRGATVSIVQVVRHGLQPFAGQRYRAEVTDHDGLGRMLLIRLQDGQPVGDA